MRKLPAVRCQEVHKIQSCIRSRARLSAGFTLVELMVVLAIVVIVSTIVLVSASRFNSSILLRSLAYEVGLSVREAQLYGVSVKSGPSTLCFGGTTSNFCSSFGVHFQGPTDYVVFADTNNNGVYEYSTSGGNTYDSVGNKCGSAAGECWVEKFYAKYGFTINNMCVSSGSALKCAVPCPPVLPPGISSCSVASNPAITSLDITFKRPNPDAIITINGTTNTLYDGAYIVVMSPGGSHRYVSTSLTGQIAVTGGTD